MDQHQLWLLKKSPQINNEDVNIFINFNFINLNSN